MELKTACSLQLVTSLMMSNSFTRNTRAAPYFQILSELLHVDLVQEDEVPEADISVERHGGGLGHSGHSGHGW